MKNQNIMDNKNENQNKELTASRFEIEQQLNQFIGNLKVEGMSTEGKKSLVRLKLKLTEILKDIEQFRKTTLDSIDKPENYDELKEAASKDNATEEVKAKFAEAEKEYGNKFGEIALPYFNEIVTMPFDFISESDFDALVEHNDINLVFGYEYIYNKLVKK